MKDALVLGINQQHLTQGIVLILVLMEDALVLGLDAIFAGKIFVLILVLMEDALVLLVLDGEEYLIMCLNPCFNGRCTRTRAIILEGLMKKLS